jgi:hypothetical protein
MHSKFVIFGILSVMMDMAAGSISSSTAIAAIILVVLNQTTELSHVQPIMETVQQLVFSVGKSAKRGNARW